MIPFKLAGMSTGFTLMGKAFDSPGLYSAASITNKFIGPSVSIGVGGYLTRQLKEVKKDANLSII